MPDAAALGPLWQPSPERIAGSNLGRFMAQASAEWGMSFTDYPALWRWSVERPEQFWASFWSFAGVIAETRGETVLAEPETMLGARFFPQARLNFARNLLRRRDDHDAMVFWAEDKLRRRLSYREIYDQVSRLQQALAAAGLKAGDRVAAYLPNFPEAIIAMLATASLGGIWSSCSPDFGIQGVIDRFGQIEPKLLIAVDGYYYNGKPNDVLGKLGEIVPRLPSVERVIVVPYLSDRPELSGVEKAVTLGDLVAPFAAAEVTYAELPFNHPLYILYSSGTTGVPKCIVHGAGGTLLQLLKEHRLHCDIRPGDRVFYFTTCSWMMWNWLGTALASEATLLLYDGSPFHPNPTVLFDLADAEGMTLFGTSAKFIDGLAKVGAAPARTHKLTTVRTMTSTGSPLVPEGFDFVYSKIKADLHLASISGGTDIISCFVLGNPISPVWRGEIQGPGLGMAVEVFDEEARPVSGEKGELVCTKPFPSMPIGFWNDPENKKYRAAYFERFPGIWCHGDWTEQTPHGGYIIYGRSDAVLNPGGVRIGTAEIYRQVEQLDEVLEGIVIGQEWKGDVRVVLFVRLREGLTLSPEIERKIRDRIRANTTPRHVPSRIVQVGDIPRTKSGKITELAVRDVVHGRAVKNREALANPEALELYKDRSELKT